MKTLFGPNSPIVRAVMLIVNVIFLNLLWLVTSLPVFTFGAATSSAYAVVYKCLRNHRNDVWHEFFACFKSDFKRTTLTWLVFLGIAVVFGFDISILVQLRDAGKAIGNIYVLFIVLLVLEALYFIYVFAGFARFENPVKAALASSAVLAIRSLGSTFALLVLLAAACLAMYLIPVSVCVAPVLFLWLASLLLERIYRRYMTEEQRQKEDELNAIARANWNGQ